MRTVANGLALLLLAACFYSCAVAQNKSDDNSRAASAKTTLEHMKEGSAFFLKGDYRRAIKPYQKALDLEKKQPTLDKTLWRVLVDNLGMAYGMTGDLQRAKETFEYGIAKDPDYPMFHYNMACTYAEMNDEDRAITYLRSAFRNKENVNEGERMPDPATDDSFRRYMKDEKFLNALKGIEGQ